MPRTKIPANAYRVSIIESETGWGRKVDEVIYFDNEEEAIKYVSDYNKKYNLPTDHTPGWYMFAQYDGKVRA